jgi:hypothetical protein
MVHAAREEHADQAAETLRDAIMLSDQPLPGGLPLVMDRIVS